MSLRLRFTDLVIIEFLDRGFYNINESLGINFPCYAFENQAETEGFAKMATRAGYEVIGLPNYVVWHIDTEEKGGNK